MAARLERRANNRPPRFQLLGLTVALFALAVGLDAFDGAADTLGQANLSPASLYCAVHQSAHRAYTHVLRVASGLQLLYEINSRFPAPAPRAPQPPADRSCPRSRALASSLPPRT